MQVVWLCAYQIGVSILTRVPKTRPDLIGYYPIGSGIVQIPGTQPKTCRSGIGLSGIRFQLKTKNKNHKEKESQYLRLSQTLSLSNNYQTNSKSNLGSGGEAVGRRS